MRQNIFFIVMLALVCATMQRPLDAVCLHEDCKQVERKGEKYGNYGWYVNHCFITYSCRKLCYVYFIKRGGGFGIKTKGTCSDCGHSLEMHDGRTIADEAKKEYFRID